MTEKAKSTAPKPAKKTANIWVKLKEFQDKQITITKNAEGYGYKYATLDEVNAIIKPVLSELGLVITHAVVSREISYINQYGNFVETKITCVDTGEFVSSDFPLVSKLSGEMLGNIDGDTIKALDKQIVAKLIAQKHDMQTIGSDTTYAKRYNTGLLLNLDILDDTDGANPSVKEEKKPQQAAQKVEMSFSEDDKEEVRKVYAERAKEMGKELSDLTTDELAKIAGGIAKDMNIPQDAKDPARVLFTTVFHEMKSKLKAQSQ